MVSAFVAWWVTRADHGAKQTGYVKHRIKTAVSIVVKSQRSWTAVHIGLHEIVMNV